MSQFKLIPLKYIEDERGAVLHFVKKDDVFFDSFGECYFSWINPGIVKGWYRHRTFISCLTCPTTNLQIVLFDELSPDNISIINITKENYGIIKIPNNIWYSFRSLDDKPALIASILNEKHDQNEKEVLPLDTNKIPFDWSKNA